MSYTAWVLLRLHLWLGPEVLGPVQDDGLGLLEGLLVIQLLLTELRHLGPAVALHWLLLQNPAEESSCSFQGKLQLNTFILHFPKPSYLALQHESPLQDEGLAEDNWPGVLLAPHLFQHPRPLQKQQCNQFTHELYSRNI